MATSDDIDRLRQGFQSVRIADHILATPPTPTTTPTSRMHLLSGLRTAPKTQTPAKVFNSLRSLLTDAQTRGYTHPNVNGVANGYDYGMQSPNPRITLSQNNFVDGQQYYTPNHNQRQSRGHKHQHSRGSSVSSLQVPMAPSPVMRPDTPESPPDSFDPQLYASLQQQYLELLATNQYLVQQHQQIQLQQQYNIAHHIHPLAFLSPPRTPVSACLPPQYIHDSPSSYLSPGQERYQFQSPRRSRFDTCDSESSARSAADVPFRAPSPANSPSPASSESSWRRGHRRGKSSISVNGNAPKQPQPVRQPYGPPPMETLLANKAAGTQTPNFHSRMRRKAMNRLMQVGLERKQSSPGPGVSHLAFQDARGEDSVEGTPVESESGDDEFDPRRRSALF
jgi:hypothetical protein